MGIRKNLSAVSDTAAQTLTVTAAAGGLGQLSGYTGAYAVAFTLVNLDSDYGVEYKAGGGPWTYLGKKVGTSRLIGSPAGVMLRLVGDGATSVKVEASVELAPVQDDPLPFDPARGAISGPASNLTTVSNFQTNGSTVRNYAMAISMPDEFSAVRLVFLNHQSVAATVDDHAVAASSTAYPGGVFNINAPESAWVAAGTAVVIPAAKGTTQGERDKRPGIALGPVLQIRSIPRAAGELDGGRYPLLFIRTLALAGNANMPVGNEVANFPTLYDPVNAGMSILSTAFNSSGNFTTSNQAGWVTASARETTPILACFGAVATYDKSYTTVMGLGDSIMAGGADGASGRAPFTFKAVNQLRNKGKRAGFYNGSISGSAMDSITIRGKDLFDLFQPSITVMAPYSTNGTGNLALSTQAGWDNNWYQLMEMVRTIHAAGKIAVLTTPLPFATFTPTQNVFRLKQRQRVMESGLPFVDFESFANSVGRWANAEDTQDGTHLTQLGHEKAAALLMPVLDAMIA